MRTSARCRSGSRAPARAGSHRRARAAARDGSVTSIRRSGPGSGSSAPSTRPSTVVSLGPRPRCPRLEAREIEQVAHHAVEPLRLDQGGLRTSARRCSAPSSSRGPPSPSSDALMAVSGEWRSWLTERSSAVFRVSLRRSASASSASWASRSRSSANPRTDGQGRQEAALALEISRWSSPARTSFPTHAVAGAKLG